MRVVADTNVIVSGVFWGGPPHLVLEAAHDGKIVLLTTPVLLAELEDVLRRAKFSPRLERAGSSPQDAVGEFASVAIIVTPTPIPPTVVEGPDDDRVIECALGGAADLIVSGDQHLLALGVYRGIRIVSVAELLSLV